MLDWKLADKALKTAVILDHHNSKAWGLISLLQQKQGDNSKEVRLALELALSLGLVDSGILESLSDALGPQEADAKQLVQARLELARLQ
jgi:hypothetical protein